MESHRRAFSEPDVNPLGSPESQFAAVGRWTSGPEFEEPDTVGYQYWWRSNAFVRLSVSAG